MGESRRKRLMDRKRDSKLDLKRKPIEDRRAEIAKLRKEYDSVAKPWRKHLLDFAERVGPSIFPKEDGEAAQFLIDRMVRLKSVGEPLSNDDDISVLAALLDPFIRQKPAIMKEGFELLTRRVQESIDRAGATALELGAAIPQMERDVSLILSAIYAERMLSRTDLDVFVPFSEIDWAKYGTSNEMAQIGKNVIGSFLLAEESLRGNAAVARDAFNSLVEEEQERYIEMARSLKRSTREKIGQMLRGDAVALQKVFDASFDVTIESDPRIGKDVAGLFSFALAKMIVKELTVTQEKMLKAAESSELVSLHQMEAALTGEARIGRMTYSSLEQDERIKVDTYVGAFGGVELVSVDGIPNITALQRSFDRFHRALVDGELHDAEAFVTENAHLAVDWVNVLAYAFAKKTVGLAMEESAKQLIERKLDGIPKHKQHEALTELADRFDVENRLNSQTKIWDDHQLTQVGVALWEKTYKLEQSDTDAALAARKIAESWARERGEDRSSARLRVVEDITCFSAKWAVHAFQRITTTHTYAAALMCSDADKAVLSDIELQWSAFMVCLPNGLLSYVDEGGVKREYNRILVGSYDKSASLILLNQHGDWSQPNILSHYGNSIADVLTVESDDDDGSLIIDDSIKDKIQRITTLARRLVAGLLLALQTKENFKSTVHQGKASKKGRLHAEPSHRVVFVGGALKIDCRPSIARFIEHGRSNRGGGAAPAFQTLVRGHFRRQVCGVGRRDRKILFIEPFWRGPEDAPILTRPKRVSI